ncbi:hypothetical protein [Microbacterium murale]|uniref:hypothetical protein n=1 Tax=Microbacterium murale TaxID=1081040 RepID=UPI00166E2856|nr:hypothetical protein [Microbacterium murale]
MSLTDDHIDCQPWFVDMAAIDLSDLAFAYDTFHRVQRLLMMASRVTGGYDR